jgi:Ni/Co efflux regulator RcnB
MAHGLKIGLCVAGALLMAGAGASAQNKDEHAQDHAQGKDEHAQPSPQPGARAARPQAPKGEAHAGPTRYARVAEPEGWNKRPAAVERGSYQHNFQAARSFHIGPYHRPVHWAAHHWAYGQTLPNAYWASEYLLADYWLFGLEVPPGGYEWVRDDDDAILVNTGNGEILQVEYGAFS